MWVAFGLVMGLQLFHFVEHVAQLVQKDVVHSTSTGGFLGAWLDVEWVHFIYNVGLGIALLMLFFGYRMYSSPWRKASRIGWYALVGGILFQVGWHVPEHASKLYQFLAYGWDPAPGILGHTPTLGSGPFPLIYLHFAYNVVVTGLMAAAYLAYRSYRRPPDNSTMEAVDE